jgi:hypothetical protein
MLERGFLLFQIKICTFGEDFAMCGFSNSFF